MNGPLFRCLWYENVLKIRPGYSFKKFRKLWSLSSKTLQKYVFDEKSQYVKFVKWLCGYHTAYILEFSKYACCAGIDCAQKQQFYCKGNHFISVCGYVEILRFLVAIGCQSKQLILHDYFNKNYEFIPYLKMNFKSHKRKKKFFGSNTFV